MAPPDVQGSVVQDCQQERPQNSPISILKDPSTYEDPDTVSDLASRISSLESNLRVGQSP
jgi:hypothetical protein